MMGIFARVLSQLRYLIGPIFEQVVEFKWDSQKKSLALSSFSFGYIFTVLGGMIAKKYGGVTVFGAGVGLTGLITLLTPMLLYSDFRLFLVSRALEGWFEVSVQAGLVLDLGINFFI